MNIANIIDHTNLKPTATKFDIKKLCDEAKQYKFASVCISPCYVAFAAEELQGSVVDVCTVVGFPLGSNTTESKVFETKKAIEDGATEIDMVINIGAVKANDVEAVVDDIKAVKAAAGDKVVKVILETCLLDESDIIKACQYVLMAKADFVKTSTGFSTGGATAEVVKLMAETVMGEAGVKASGGIRSLEDAEKMVKAGATRLGCSSGVQIATGKKDSKNSHNY